MVTCRRYASYWNAFLFTNVCRKFVHFIFFTVFGVGKHGACCRSIRGLLCSSGGRIQPQYSHWPEKPDTRLTHWGMCPCAWRTELERKWVSGFITKQWRFQDFPQWSIQDFPDGVRGAQTLEFGAKTYLARIFPKTAWKWKKLNREGGPASLVPPCPTDPPVLKNDSQQQPRPSPNFPLPSGMFKLIEFGPHCTGPPPPSTDMLKLAIWPFRLTVSNSNGTWGIQNAMASWNAFLFQNKMTVSILGWYFRYFRCSDLMHSLLLPVGC